MSNKLTDLVHNIQYSKGKWTVQQVAESIGYSRVRLTQLMQQKDEDENTRSIENKLREKHKDILQNVSEAETNYKEKFYCQLEETNKLLKDLAEAKERCVYLENVIKSNLEKSLSNQFLMMRQIAVASRMIVENASQGDQKKLQENLDRIDRLVSAVRD